MIHRSYAGKTADITVERHGRSSPRPGQIEAIPGVTQLSGPGQCTLPDQVLQISRRRGTGRSGYADIVLCALSLINTLEHEL